MTSDTLARLMDDPAAFRRSLLIDADGGPRLLGTCLDPWQASDFTALDASWQQVVSGKITGAVTRAYLERPRGHSKTSDLAVMVVWALLAARRSLSGVAAAADRDQARLLRDAIQRLVLLNPWLREFVEVQAYKAVNPHTGSTLEILSADAPSSYGLTPDFILADELTHWGSSPDLWTSLFSSAAKRAHCLLVVISNAGVGIDESWQWQTREAARIDARWYFSRLDAPQASWITPDRLAEQRRILPAVVYQRLWLNEWTSGSGDALRHDDIDAAVEKSAAWKPGWRTRPRAGWCYLAGADLSVSRDATAVVVIAKSVGACRAIERPVERAPLPHAMLAAVDSGLMADPRPPETREVVQRIRGTGKVRLVDVKLWQPTGGSRVSLSEVEDTIARLHARYDFSCVAIDPWQAEQMSERLESAGVPMRRVPFSGGNLVSMAGAVLSEFADGNIELYDHRQLVADLKKLRVVEKSYGARLDSARDKSGHADSATALALALLASREFTEPEGDLIINRPLVY